MVIDQRRFSFLPQVPLEDLTGGGISGTSHEDVFIFRVEPDAVHHLPFRRHRMEYFARFHVPDPRKAVEATRHELRCVWC